ncbi:MAG: tetratricopeptide repeat protein [Pyrinomonadaceae bacterium]
MKKEFSVAFLFAVAMLSSGAVYAQTANRSSDPNATPDDSREIVSNTLDDDARAARKYYDSGIVAYNSGRLDQAIESFKQAAKAEPDNPQSHYMLGMAYSKSKAFKEAADSFKRAAKLKPDWPEAHFHFGIMSYVLGRKSQSAQEYDKLVKLNSPLANTLYRIIKEEGNSAGTSASNVESAKTVKELSSLKETQMVPASASTTSAASPKPASTSKEVSNRTSGDSNLRSASDQTPTAAIVSPGLAKPDSNSDVGIRKSASDDSQALAEIYRIGIGDVLDIRLLNSSTPRSTLYTVIDGGLIDLPIAGGPIAVAGLTPDEVQTRIALELKRRAVEEGSRVSVGVRQYASHGVVITGLVNNPGTKFLRREAVPLYVIMAEAQARLDAGRVAVMRAGSAGLPMDLSDPEALNIMIRPGDTISVTARPQEFYYIAGRINYPGQKIFQPGITLLQAILAAGGTTRPNSNTIEVSRKGPDGLLTTTKFSVKEIKAGKIHDPKVQPGDLIDVVN